MSLEIVKAKLLVVANKAGEAKLTPEDAKALLEVLTDAETRIAAALAEAEKANTRAVSAEETRDLTAQAYAARVSSINDALAHAAAAKIDADAWKAAHEDLVKKVRTFVEAGRRIPDDFRP